MKLVIKVGGTLLDEAACRTQIARQLAYLAKRQELVIVHGGGRQLTRYLEKHGVQSRFLDGLRVSDEEVVEAATKIIAGSVNKQLVAAMLAAGERAVGLSGVDGLLTSAVQLGPELQFAGRPSRTDSHLLDLLLHSGYLPVLACIAADSDGNIYNVNADQMAVSCALGWRAAKLIFLTDVEGVKDDKDKVIDRLSPEQVKKLIHGGVAKAGMQAKLNAAVAALEGGVEEVDIASGHEARVCERILENEPVGTRLSLESVSVKGARL